MPITVRLEKDLVENFPIVGDLVKQGKNEGFLEGKQESLIKILEAKFGRIGESLQERIEGIKEAKRLDELLIIAIQVADLEEFEKKILEDYNIALLPFVKPS